MYVAASDFSVYTEEFDANQFPTSFVSPFEIEFDLNPVIHRPYLRKMSECALEETSDSPDTAIYNPSFSVACRASSPCTQSMEDVQLSTPPGLVYSSDEDRNAPLSHATSTTDGAPTPTGSEKEDNGSRGTKEDSTFPCSICPEVYTRKCDLK